MVCTLIRKGPVITALLLEWPLKSVLTDDPSGKINE
jgi:hypothetical protein